MSITANAGLSPPHPMLVAEAESIDTMREQIDDIDAAIAELLLVRSQLSQRVQMARMSAGGPRVLLSRERAIRAHYGDLMGADGLAIADAVLRLCRGD